MDPKVRKEMLQSNLSPSTLKSQMDPESLKLMHEAADVRLKRVISLNDLWSRGGASVAAKEANYFDCHADKVVIYPGGETIASAALHEPGNALERRLDRNGNR